MSIKSLKAGNRNFSGLAGQVPEHHVLLQEVTVGAGGVSNVTFSNIPADYQHLQIRAIIRTSTDADPTVRFNSDSGNNYSTHRLFGTGATTISDAFTSTSIMYLTWTSDTYYGGYIIDILDYASTSKNKTMRSIGGIDKNGSGRIGVTSGLWMNTSAINSVSIFTSIQQYSSFQLYGVK